MPNGETIAAAATPPGESALALIRLSGPDSPHLACELFNRTEPPAPRRAFLGHYRSLAGTTLDHVVATLWPEGQSFTGEAMLELSCHGNPFLVRRILEDLFARGCRPAAPGEFTRTAFLNGRMDLSQAEAVADLIRARSDHALETARRQLEGALGKRMAAFAETLLQLLAEVEAYIDFPDEDLPPEAEHGPITCLPRIAQLQRDLRDLAATVRYRPLLQEGIRILILGEPNAGKSSLLNALLGEDRAIVSPEPGTTRDFLTERLILGRHCLRLIDTAGLRPDPTSATERLGMEKTLEKLREADCVLLLVDSTREDPTLPAGTTGLLSPEKTLVIENKIDLPGTREHPQLLPGAERCRVSLLTGQGLPELRQNLEQFLDRELFSPDPEGLTVNTRHAEALNRTCANLEQALRIGQSGAARAPELMASELRLGLDAIGEITGRMDNEAMLDRLFSSFCIGK